MPIPVLYFIIPCFNEEKVILTTAQRMREKLSSYTASGLVSPQSRICFVDDGSSDRTWALLLQLYDAHDNVVILRHNRNYGEQYAYLTGIRYAASHADCMISMDADLQDDLDASDEMLREYFRGREVVYGARGSRKQDSLFQRVTSRLFYTIMRLAGTKLVPEHSQYRLLSRDAAQALVRHAEQKIFLPALVPLLGFPESVVYYARKPREAGTSHYNVRSLTRLAHNAILSYGVNLPRLLLVGAGADVLCGVLAAILRGSGRAPAFSAAVMLTCFLGAAGFAGLYLCAKSALRKHLRAKKRPGCGEKRKIKSSCAE